MPLWNSFKICCKLCGARWDLQGSDWNEECSQLSCIQSIYSIYQTRIYYYVCYFICGFSSNYYISQITDYLTTHVMLIKMIIKGAPNNARLLIELLFVPISTSSYNPFHSS
jgi:hypothetical protein